MSGFQTPITIAKAIEQIEGNRYLLPAFQRDFVWKAEQIEMLFDSLMRGYPISSMLFWMVKGQNKSQWNFYHFIKRFVKDSRDFSVSNDLYNSITDNDFYAVLDGQQRLTALNIALKGTYAFHTKNSSWDYSPNSFPDRRLYLCIENAPVDEEYEYLFKFLRDDMTKCEDLFRDTDNKLWFKVGHIINIHNIGIYEYAEDNSLSREQRKTLVKLDKLIYDEPVINFYLEEDNDPDKAINIFTRINSGGTTLEFSDIVYSLIVANWKTDAKAKINGLINAISQKGFDIDKDYLVKSFLYLYHKSIKTEIKNFTTAFCEIIEYNWDKIRDCITAMFDLLHTYGLTSATLTSNNATLPILYYLYHNDIYQKYSTKIYYKSEREIIKKWLLSIILRKAFKGQTDATLTQTRKAFTTDIETRFLNKGSPFPADQLSKNIKNLDSVDDELLDDLLSYQKDNRYAFIVLSLLYPNLDYNNNGFHKDHIHPVSTYSDLDPVLQNKYPFEIYNSILNLQMLSPNENTSKSNKSLKDWIYEQTTPATKKEFLESHLIPDVDLSLNNFDEFIIKRKELLKKALKALLV